LQNGNIEKALRNVAAILM